MFDDWSSTNGTNTCLPASSAHDTHHAGASQLLLGTQYARQHSPGLSGFAGSRAG